MLVWERPEPPDRPVPSPLSRDRIVAAALRLADEDGLAAVSLRKVAAALDVGPMRLYGYIDTKEELLVLMLDAVHAEIRPTGTGWREVLTSLAEATRQAAHRHEWFAELVGGRPHPGPHTLAAGEAVAAGLAGVPLEVAVPAIAAVNAYVVGAIRRENAERHAERTTGMDREQWQKAYGPYLVRRFAGGELPAMERVVRDGPHLSPDETFRAGLEFVLDGIGARIGG